MDWLYDLPDYEKEKYLEKKYRDFSYDELKKMLEQIEDERVCSRTKYNIISNMSILSLKDIDILKGVFDINLSIIRNLVNIIDIDISDLLDFEYDYEEEIYIIKKNNLSKIIGSLSDINEIKNIINIWKKNRERLYFKNNSYVFQYTDLINYKEKENQYYDELFKNSITLSEKKDIFFKKYYNIDLKSFKQIKKKYHNNGFMSYLEKEYQSIIEVFNCNNIDDLNNKYMNYQEDNNIMEKIRSEFIMLCVNDVTNTINDFSFPKNYIEKNNVKVFDISDIKFNLLIHRTNSVSNNIEINPLNWNNYDIDGKTTISCSGISNLFLGRVEKDDEEQCVYFGFTHINADEIVDMGPCNINMSDMINDNMPDSIYGRNFMAFDELMINSFDQYNEIALFRYNQITGEKISPSYIVCFDEISEYELNVAQAMKLPIIYIDTEKVYQQTRVSLNDLIKNPEIYKNCEINFKTAKKILAFAYGTYCSGRMEIDQNTLNIFLKNTLNSSLSPEYKEYIYKYCYKINNSIGFGLGDKYTIHK